MLRNLPNNYTRDMLLELIDSLGFRGQYAPGFCFQLKIVEDFIYLPIDFQTQACLGYAFVNLVDPGASTQTPVEFRARGGAGILEGLRWLLELELAQPQGLLVNKV